MATKAQLEAELAELRQQLADRTPNDPLPDQESSKTDTTPQQAQDGDDVEPDFDTQVGELLAAFDDIPAKKPLLLALGVFALGYMIGRSR